MSLESRIESLDIRGANQEQVAEHGRLLLLRDERDAGRLIECLNDGFVRLVDHMGDDAAICQAARVSYGRGTKSVSDDRNLIRYLMRHRHTTPFEMAEVKLHVRVPMHVWRQWIRHRTASVNEYSTRYSEAIDSTETTDTWRLQSTNNRQGSTGGDLQWPEGYRIEPSNDGHRGLVVLDDRGQPRMLTLSDTYTPTAYLSAREHEVQGRCRDLYEERLRFGVAREQARKDLPLSTYTEAYWKCDLHNLLHFLELRMDSHAQIELRTYANSVARLIKPLYPRTWEAFQDYRLGAIVLTLPEIEEIKRLLHPDWTTRHKGMSSREQEELRTKLDLLGISVK